MKRTMFKLLLDAADKGGAGAGGDKGGAAGGDKGGAAGAGDKAGDKGAAGGDGDKGAGDGNKGGGDSGEQGAGDKAGNKGSENKGGAKGGDGKAGTGAPEKYELSLPKEQERLDADDLKAIEVVARAKGWTNEEAQAQLEEHLEAIETQSNRFLEETKSDPVYGGDKLDQTVALANKALDRLHPKGTPEGDRFRKLLTKSGYGNNVAVLAHLAKLGKMMAEDKSALGAGEGGGEKTAEQILYGGTTSKVSA